MRVRYRKIGVDKGEGELDLPAGATGLELLRAISMSPEIVLLAKGGEIVPVDLPLEPDDEIQIMRIVTGG